MPVFNCAKSDLENMMRRNLSIEEIDRMVLTAKGEFKDYNEETDELRIEIVDSNRPDLWSVEGLTRQIRSRESGIPIRYPFFSSESSIPAGIIYVDAGLENVRPYIAGFVAEGAPITEELLVQVIQTQEKLSENFGRKRKTIATGVYDGRNIDYPIKYEAADPAVARFAPLGFDEEMSLLEILEKHPTGRKFASILEGNDRFPLLRDAGGKVLSFPPIINSSALGEIKVGDSLLFVEVTGQNLEDVLIAVNIFACNLHDRGFEITSVLVEYPFDTPMGREVITPAPTGEAFKIELAEVEKLLGISLTSKKVAKALTGMGFEVEKRREASVTVRPPSFRKDCIHAVDFIEDIAISFGYDSFDPVMPEDFTVGSLSPVQELLTTARRRMAGLGFQEMMTKILSAPEEMFEKMNMPRGKLIEIANPVASTISVLRNHLLPSILEVESQSSHAPYPHLIFEAGETADHDPDSAMKSRTDVKLAALQCHTAASFSEMHGFLDAFLYSFDIKYRLTPSDHPSFMEGRAAKIVTEDGNLGVIGEIAPVVLENWGITRPCAAFEVDLGKFPGV